VRHSQPLDSLSSLPLVWLAVALSACAAAGPPPLAPEEEAVAQAQYEQAQELLAVDADTATAELERFLRDWPGSDLADDAALELGRRAAAEGELDRAARHLVWATRMHPRGDRIDEIQLLLAEVEKERGHTEAAYRTAARIRVSRLPTSERHRVHVLLAELAGARGEQALSLRWWGRARGSAPDQPGREAVDAAMDEQIAGLSRAELDRALDDLDGRFPALRLELRAVELALADGDADRARLHLQEAERLEATADEEARLAALAAQLDELGPTGPSAAELPGFGEVEPGPSPAGARGTIGVVLPLSGPFGGFGEECLRGVLLAAGVFGGDDGAGGVRVLVRDSGGRPEGAAAAVEELASRRVSAIVGPLLASEAEAAAAAAERVRVPLLALTGRDQVARSRPWVFRVGREPRGEIQVLVDHVVREVGLGRFAILYPDDAYGRGARDLFWDEAEARGGRIVGVQSYEPGATDFAGPIRDLVGYVMLTAAEKEALEEREDMLDAARRLPPEEALALREEARALLGPDDRPLPPIVDFDALFLPDAWEQVTLIAPQLAFHEVGDVRLLGSSGWNHPDLVRIGRDHVEGAIFTETFFPDSEVAYVAAFTGGFDDAFGTPPGSLAALSFDAANLVLVQLARGLHARDALRQALLDVRAYPGVSGVTTVRSDGTAQKRPYLLGVTGRKIHALD
jgi:ABC-type branched-subunit amino acid transport system substrate-binding protein/predicted negative regulator of RcsB-dependent stress response